MNDKNGSEMSGPGSDMPAEPGTPGQATSFLTGVRGVIRTLAYLALILVLAVVISRAMQFVMGLLCFTSG